MKSSKAFAPANISLIFKIHEHTDPAESGSTGMGFTLNKGVEVEVFLSEKTKVFFNGKKIDFPTVKSVIKKIIPFSNKVSINISSLLPLGCGFGLSGASAMAVSFALNKLFNLGKTNLELAKIAHVAEVENQTGLGDVVNQYFGGFLLKTENSSQFRVKRIPIENIPVYCKYFSGISTSSILSNEELRKKIDNAGLEAHEKVNNALNKKENDRLLFNELISISKEFAEKSGLMKDQNVIKSIKNIEALGGHASMIMLGNAVVSDMPFEGAEKLLISEKNATIL